MKNFVLLTSLLLAGCGTARSPALPNGALVRHPSSGGTDFRTCVGACDPIDPIDYGTCNLTCAQASTGSDSTTRVLTADDPNAQLALQLAGVELDGRPESFAIVASDDSTLVIGRDAAGAMYGALELAERLRLNGAQFLPLSESIARAPTTAIRAANLFLVLPATGETSWWFLDQAFWREYLEMMVQARMNFLDMHAMYHLGNTLFPNALLYFANSQSFPSVGAPAADRAANLAMLNTVIQMANARAIQVGLMSYRSDSRLIGEGTPPLGDNSDELKQYTYEAARDLATRASGLARLGFRIGESGHAASWYLDTFVQGVQDAGTGVKTYTRTWGSNKTDVMSIVARAGEDTIVEAKYNGEQLGAPYVIAGGIFSNPWSNYSYENYLNPPAPYPFVFQVRAFGTHRAFRYAAYERTRRTALSFGMSPYSAGFTLEAAHAYFPQRDFLHRDEDKFSEWTFRRDELSYLLFGRLSYDPLAPESAFRLALQDRTGTDELWNAVQAASDIVPWIQTAHTCGPDHRDYAPELEFGGPVAYWATASTFTPRPPHSCGSRHTPFDAFAVALPVEAADDLVQGRSTSRISPIEIARVVLDDVQRARTAADVAIDPSNPEARDVQRECLALADLGEWFAHKLRSASALAVYQQTAVSEYLDAARNETALAGQAWRNLASDTAHLQQFVENLRMQPLGVSPFHWGHANVLARLDEDPSSIDQVQAAVESNPPSFTGDLPPASDWLNAVRAPGPRLASLDFDPPDPSASSWTVSASFGDDLPAGSTVNILWKRFRALAGDNWSAVPATQVGSSFQASISGGGEGGLFAVEILAPGGAGWRYPDVFQETPYRALAP